MDSDALYRALKSGRVLMAGLDVWDPEPISPRDPLLRLPNVVVLPHMGTASILTRSKMGLMAVDNLLIALGLRSGRGAFRVAISTVIV